MSRFRRFRASLLEMQMPCHGKNRGHFMLASAETPKCEAFDAHGTELSRRGVRFDHTS